MWFSFSSTLGFFYSVVRWGNLDINRDFARLFSWGVVRILGFKVEVEGTEHIDPDRPCVYVANHQSGLDMATFGTVYPRRTIVIGKKEVKWMPFFGIFYVAAGNVLIDRNKTSKAVAGLNHTVEIIKEKKVSIWIFPEGTRNTKGEGMLPFKRGAFHMARQAGIPIVPMVSASLKPLVNWDTMKSRGGVVKIRILPPIDTRRYNETQVEQLTQETREKMLAALKEITT